VPPSPPDPLLDTLPDPPPDPLPASEVNPPPDPLPPPVPDPLADALPEPLPVPTAASPSPGDSVLPAFPDDDPHRAEATASAANDSAEKSGRFFIELSPLSLDCPWAYVTGRGRIRSPFGRTLHPLPTCAYVGDEARSGARKTLVVTAASVAAFTVALPQWNRLALTAGTHVYLKPAFVLSDTHLELFHEDSFGGITTVVDNFATVDGIRRPYRTLLTNGKFQGNDAGETIAQVGFAMLPILHARGFDRACVIGLGTGQSARVFSDLGFSSVDVAEISPGIVAASPYFAEIKGRLLQRPRVHLWLEDGRSLLSLHPDLACDVVSLEISSVWFAGSTNLYSREFYAIARQRLGDSGVLQQWIQVHHIGFEELATVLATVRAVFPHVTFWIFGAQGIIVASGSPLELSTEGAARFFAAAPALGFDPAQAQQLFVAALSSRLLSGADVTRLSSEPSVLLNTDRNRRLEYATARYAVSTVDLATQNIDALGRRARFTPLHVASDYPPEYLALVDRADVKRQVGRGPAPVR
jgi:spermidine synthase